MPTIAWIGDYVLHGSPLGATASTPLSVYTNNNGLHTSQPSAVQLIARRLNSADSNINTSDHQKYVIQVVSTTMASISITASFLALYWFCLMRRNYRRDLVLTLILSDVFKNFCYIMFSGVSLTQGQVQSSDAFCQASGYMLQTGLEACDFAIFFISLHMTLQIFPMPNTILGYDGLYNVRYWVYAIWFILPNITASLAFINSAGAYQVQGAWCWLPVRPFWYRLALAWVPRYVISISTLCFAITIYIYVGTEFRIFSRERDRASSTDADSSTQHTGNRSSTVNPSPPGTIYSNEVQDEMLRGPAEARLLSFGSLSYVPDQSTAFYQYYRDARRHSLPTWNTPFDGASLLPIVNFRGSQSTSTSRRGSRQVAFDLPEAKEEPLSPLQRPVDAAMPALPRSASYEPTPQESSPTTYDQNAELAALEESRTNASTLDTSIKARRRAIRRQVRGLFVYPIAYIFFWILPFVMHCMNYSDYFAAHPVFAIVLLASICTTSLGLVDVIIFCWREQPWRHISGSDGSLAGSFCFWRFDRVPFSRRSALTGNHRRHHHHDEKAEIEEQSGLKGFLKRLSWRRLSSSADTYTSSSNRSSAYRPRTGGGADSKVREREQAQERLQMERAAVEKRQREGSMERARAVVPSVHSPGGKNWFDDIIEVDENAASRMRWS